jgi:hypothetical protein
MEGFQPIDKFLGRAVSATDPNYPTKHLSKANQVFSHEQLRLNQRPPCLMKVPS